jgi:hypothetical protein
MLKRNVLAVMFALVATVALAVTVAELEQVGNALLADYVELDGRVDDCPDGKCAEAGQILDDFDALEEERADMHADRQTLNPCTNCGSLDATIGQVDALAASIAERVMEWEQSS